MSASKRRALFVLALVAGLVAAPLTAWATEGDPGDDIPAEGAIIGGTTAPTSRYPFMVGVLFHRDNPQPSDAFVDQFCGGSVVATRWVVTAAHCVTQAAPGGGGQATVQPLDALVGTTSLAGGGQRIPVDQIVVHPDYLRDFRATPDGKPVSGQRHDIALLHLGAAPAAAGVVPFSDAARPTPGPGTRAWAAGWGMRAAGDTNSFPYELEHVDLELWSDDACRSFYPSLLHDASMVCAYEDGPPGEPSHDTCSGDSGGPLVVESAGQWLLVGLTSFGISCGVAPGVYTQVESYGAWIHSYVDPPPVTTTTTPPSTTPPSTTAPDDRSGSDPGYWMLGADCARYAFGSAKFHLLTSGSAPHDCVAMTSTPAGDGYWLLDRSGGVSAYGAAAALASPDLRGVPAAGISATSTGQGYWVVDVRGNVFAVGDAVALGGVGHLALNSPIIAMTTAPDGSGYWLLAADGGVFTFGGARFWGSTGDIRLNQPVVSMAATTSGNGYWLVASDGGVFAFGDASFFGSMGGTALNRPVNGMSRTPSGLGYWMVASDGGVFAFGDAGFVGSLGAVALSAPVVGLEPSMRG